MGGGGGGGGWWMGAVGGKYTSRSRQHIKKNDFDEIDTFSILNRHLGEKWTSFVLDFDTLIFCPTYCTDLSQVSLRVSLCTGLIGWSYR